ncbi:MAG: hypothetical protein ACYTEU_07805 [Planctomycetota bacterium]
MPHLNSIDEQHKAYRRPWLLGLVICLCMLVMISFATAMLFAGEDPGSDNEYTQAQLLEDTLGVAHDEIIMLIISLVVVIQVTASFKFIRQLPHWYFLLCSFAAVALSAFFTVTESFVFTEQFNYLEHLSFMAGAILLAIWCGLVFGFKKREDI